MIRTARVNKERALQLQEKAQIAAQEAEYDKVYDTVSDWGLCRNVNKAAGGLCPHSAPPYQMRWCHLQSAQARLVLTA